MRKKKIGHREQQAIWREKKRRQRQNPEFAAREVARDAAKGHFWRRGQQGRGQGTDGARE